MILIISNSQDSSTTHILQWLKKYKHKYVLINEYNQIRDVLISRSKKKQEIKIHTTLGDIINFDEIKSCWYRRGNFYFEDKGNKIPENFSKYQQKEWKVVNDFLFTELKKKYLLGDFFNSSLNKLNVLCKADNLGLNIPTTLITNNKKDVQKYFNDEPIINKSIGEVYTNQIEKEIYTNRTELVTINELTEHFFPSKFQNLINKKYELRIFYIEKVLFSAAIFSQQNKQTSVDFRNYDNETPNRIVPFDLPIEVRLKLDKLMQELELNTGSIDMIVTADNEYIFLEVNPVGQFGMVSQPCNYNCEHHIAKLLIENDK